MIEIEKQLEKLRKKYKKADFFYIKKNGYYYRPDACGYTDQVWRAGIYEKEDAFSHLIHCDELTLIPIDIQTHNSILMNQIKEISTRLIEKP